MSNSHSIPGYRIERLLAKGGMAEVYLAEQLSLGRKVAIKLLDAHAGDAEFAERFLQEARLVAGLHHPNVITIYDFGQLEGGKLFIIMELLEGNDLEHHLLRGLKDRTILRIVRELAQALRFIHNHGIIHRDIKPANILFRRDGSLVLTDFGIAKKENASVGLTQAGMMVGSAAYSSPEQSQGLPVDARTDIYSVGVVLLEMLTGGNPFRAESFVNTAMNHIQMAIPRLPDACAAFQPALDRMLAKKPSERFSSAEELLAALNAIQLDQAQAVPSKVAAPSVATQRETIVVPKAPPASGSPGRLDPDSDDDFFAEAMQLLNKTDNTSSPTAPPRRTPSGRQPVATPPRGTPPKPASPAPSRGRTGHYINVRTRPLPDNLLDDD